MRATLREDRLLLAIFVTAGVLLLLAFLDLGAVFIFGAIE